MHITVKSKPRSSKPSVTTHDDGTFTIAVREPAIDDRANRAIQKALADQLGVAPSRVRLVRGQKNREKVFEVAGRA
ncbi:DUF167 domain-containing protein [Candidatus Uhrbacteria bacterium]|nr:DUF167 domain-containing protein [Candidatus Uhrbacteria bacterium]